MKCPNCKKDIENGSTFCEHCGTRVKNSTIGLWIILSVIFVAIITAIVVTTILEQQRVIEAERKARKTVEHKVELVHQGYVDLSLPSGTLWNNSNEGGDYALYTYDEAINRFGNQLPTKYQLEELQNKCRWSWTGNGYKVTGSNGNSIILPAAGYRFCDGGVYYVSAAGNYWSSAPSYSDQAWHLVFDSDRVNMDDGLRCGGQSVRLVQNP